jgi:hypothetical protein
MTKSVWFRPRWILLLVAAAVLPRLPAVPVGFAIDDPWLVEQAATSTDPSRILVEAWPPGFYRPLVRLHFEVCEAVFGEWAPGYHLASIAIHAAVVVLVYLLGVLLFGAGRPAFLAALAFALFPALNEAIAWAASVGDMLATGLVVTAVLSAILASGAKDNSRRLLWIASLTAVLGGCAAKETAVVAALLVPAAVWASGGDRRSRGWMVACPAVVVAYVGWYATRVPGPGVRSMLAGSPWRCLETTVQNLVIALVPFGRNTVGDLLWSDRRTAEIVIFGVVLILGTAVVLALRAGDRITVFGLVWAVAAFVPVCRLSWAERYAYMPAVGLVIAATSLLRRCAGRYRTVVAVVVTSLLAVLTLGSVISVAQWTLQVGR